MGLAANVMVGGGLGSSSTAPMSGYPQTPSPTVSGTAPSAQAEASAGGVIDGTPTRVASFALLALAGLWGLGYQLHYKFNVVSG
jgi:hypothetical protein